MASAQAISEAQDAIGSDITYIRVRPDLHKLPELLVKRAHANRLAQFNDEDQITIVLKEGYDTDWQRSYPKVQMTFTQDSAKQVSSKYVNYLLNPETYGHLLEECDEDGAALYPNEIAGPSGPGIKQPPKPPKPRQARGK